MSSNFYNKLVEKDALLERNNCRYFAFKIALLINSHTIRVIPLVTYPKWISTVAY